MKQTTLCYIERDGKYLMMHRVKKVNDENRDKWIGIGGKLEERESPFDCIRREISEETGYSSVKLSYRGIITFVSDIYGTEYMHLFSATDPVGTLKESCDEGELVWVEVDEVKKLHVWEGDKIFLELLRSEKRFFSLKLIYEGDTLKEHILDF